MQQFTRKFWLSTFMLAVLSCSGYIHAAEASTNLKKTMKEMRFQYKKALDAQSADVFNQHLLNFKQHLASAKGYRFSPERAEVSLEGLTAVERYLTTLPVATTANLKTLQHKLEHIDQLRKTYHKKAKPGVWDMLLGLFK